MGYPMTYNRFIRRNKLDKGGYDAKSYESLELLQVYGPRDFPEYSAFDEESVSPEHYIALLREAITVKHDYCESNHVGKIKMMLGDLRRLERDSVDENMVCQYISSKIGVDKETVAAVIAAWMTV